LRRRDLIAAAALGWPLRSFAQPALGSPLVAVLWPGRPETEVDFDAALRSGLKDGGYVEGTNFAFAMRYATGDLGRLAPLAAELAALKPRVILTGSDDAVLAVHRAAPTVSTITAGMTADPVALGLAESYARPGGTVTGLTLNAGGGEEAITGKRIGLLKEVVPALARLGVIGVADIPLTTAALNGAKGAGARLGVDVLPFLVRTLDDVDAAFASGVRAGAGAFYVVGAPLLMTNRVKVAELAAHAGKPTIGLLVEQARAGLLMSYSSDLVECWRLAGGYAAKILAGAKPGDLPIEQASKFTFVINLKTAKALGITVPPRLLLLADETVD